MARQAKKQLKPIVIEKVIEKVLVVDGNGKQLSPKQAIFARVFSDPESPNFLNLTRSMKEVNPRLSDDTAHTMAREYLGKPLVANSIVERLNKANLGIEVRAEKLKDIISHRGIGKVVSHTRQLDDETVTETQHNPSWGQVLRAIDVTNKLDGSYQAANRTVDLAADEYRHLLAKHFASAPRGQGAGTGQGGKRPRTPTKNDPSGSAEAKNLGGALEPPSTDEKPSGG